MHEPAEPETSTAAALIDALLADGEPVDEGSFSLDAAAAARKLDAYQYADRSTYLIPIAEAAGWLGASRVRVTTRGEDLVITISGVHLSEPARLLADPFAQLGAASRSETTDAKTRGFGRLGVGLHMALGHGGIERIVLAYSTASEQLVAEYRRGAAATLIRRDPSEVDELQIVIDRPWTERLSLRGASHGELEHLRAAVRYSGRPFEIDGVHVSTRQRRWFYTASGAAPGYRWESGLETQREDASVIELWVADVCVETLAADGLAFRAAIHLDAPRRDLSQMQIVRDEIVEAARTDVDNAYRAALTALKRDDAYWTAADDRPSEWPEARVARVLGRELRRPTKPDRPRTAAEGSAAVLSGVPFFLIGIGVGVFGFEQFGKDRFFGLVGVALMLGFCGLGGSNIATGLFGAERSRAAAVIVLVVIAVSVAKGIAFAI